MARRKEVTLWVVGVAMSVVLLGRPVVAQKRFSLEQVLSPAYPYELVSAKKADRIAWLAYERGMRNVYTAVAPDFQPIRLTSNLQDDGNDLSALRISDDGSMVVFVRGHAPNRDGWVANPTSDPGGGEQAVWRMSTQGGAPRKVALTGSPVLSPDGAWILFVRNGQVFCASTAVGPSDPGPDAPAKPLFTVFGNNRNPVWSPDGKRIAFESQRGDHTFIGIYNFETPGITYMSPGVDHDSSPTWSTDSRQIAFVRRPGTPFGRQLSDRTQGSQGRGRGAQRPEASRQEQRPGLMDATFAGGYTLSLWVGDVETGKAREFWHNTPGDGFDTIREIEWAADNIIFQVEPHNWRHYYSVPLSGGAVEPVNLTPGEGIAEQIGLSSDGRHLFYATNVGDIDRRHIWKTPTRGGTALQLSKGTEIETYPAVLSSGGLVAHLSAGANRPQSVAVLPAEGGSPRVIFPDLPSDFPLDSQVQPENIVLTAADGLRFHNQLFVPTGVAAGERRPAVLFTHGGPQRQMLLGYHYRHFYHMAYAVNQYLANKGYVVISVNYRSGIGYGAEFRNAPNRGTRGNSEYQDVLAAGQYLQTRSDVDPARIGLWGLSYGGILTAQGLARNSDIFSAGVDIAGVHLWGDSIDPNSVSYQSSSIASIDKWTSPVLLIHGDDDRNVDFSQTTGLVQLLRAHDIYHELIVFPDDVHSSLLDSRWLTSFQAMDDFFDRFLVHKKTSQ